MTVLKYINLSTGLFALLLITCCSFHATDSFGAPKISNESSIKYTQRPYIINNKVYYPIPSAQGYSEKGVASWYGRKFHGRKTSNGETYNMYGKTAAHKTLPMNTMLLVKNLENGKKSIVRINDRGPFAKRRIIDLSFHTAKELGIIKNGTAKVVIIALAEKKNFTSGKRTSPKLNAQSFNTGQFYVQVGSFTVKKNADRLAKKFTVQKRNVLIKKFVNEKKIFFRVWVFAGKTLNKARRVEKYLSLNGFPDSFVIAR